MSVAFVSWTQFAGFLVLPGLAVAQAVHLVGPGGFAQIGPAIAAATPGDIVRVAAGSYDEFTCAKGVTIAAVPGAQVDIVPSMLSVAPLATVFQVPAGQSARVRGLHFRSPQVFQVMTTKVLGGTVAFESCTFTGNVLIDEVMLVQNSAVWLRDCVLTADTTALANPALRAQGSTIAAIDCTFRGSNLAPDGYVGAGDGIDASSSSLHLVRCTVEGGNTTILSCFYPAGDGVRTDRGDLTWIADSTLRGGSGLSSCGRGGIALRNTSAWPVRLARVSLVPGAGQVPGSGSVGPTVADPLVGLAGASAPIVLGASYRVDYRTSPNAALVVLLSLDLAPQPPQMFVEATWLPVPESLWLTTLIADSAGVATLQTAVPNLVWLRDVGIWLHAADLLSGPWHLAPPIGGLAR